MIRDSISGDACVTGEEIFGGTEGQAGTSSQQVPSVNALYMQFPF